MLLPLDVDIIYRRLGRSYRVRDALRNLILGDQRSRTLWLLNELHPTKQETSVVALCEFFVEYIADAGSKDSVYIYISVHPLQLSQWLLCQRHAVNIQSSVE